MNRQVYNSVISISLLCWQPVLLADADIYTESTGRLALKQPMSGLSATQYSEFSQGRRLFEQMWVVAPSLDKDIDGLGPLFNSISCLQCHPANGRGHAPDKPSQRLDAMLIRLSQLNSSGEVVTPHPFYGQQLQDNAIAGVTAEGRAEITYRNFTLILDDGTAVPMREPSIKLTQGAYGDFADAVSSARIGPALVGMGLIEAISDQQIIAGADPDDQNGDGISGRINWLINPMTGERQVGRFGYKANVATLRTQVADAFHGDLGITSSVHPQQNCTTVETACQQAEVGGEPELSNNQLDAVVAYMRLLAIPKPRVAEDAQLQLGQQLFKQANCIACHRAQFTTREQARPQQLAALPIHPYSDFLLHDMGPGLADNRPDHMATGQEWRTAPLWAIGLAPTVNRKAHYLHDGRARTLLEAILWHGGEAAASQQQVIQMSTEQREALLAFIHSL